MRRRKKVFRPGRNYCVLSESTSDSIMFFKRVWKGEGKALLVSSTHPGKLREDHGLEGVDLLWVADEVSEGVRSIPAGRMKFEMSKEILGFITSNEKGVIMLEGVEFLILLNGFDDVLKFLKQILDKAGAKRITTLVSLNPKSIPEPQFVMLRQRFDDSGRPEEFRMPDEDDIGIPGLPEIPIPVKGARAAPAPQKKKSEPEAPEDGPESDGRVPTGVPGFDGLIEGGIPRRSSILLQGPPGVERDGFALRFAAEALRRGETLIITTSQASPDELRTRFRQFGVELEKYESGGQVVVIDWYSYRNVRVLGIEEDGAVYRCSKGLTNLEIAITKAMRACSKRSNRICAVVDVLSPAITVLKFDPVYKFAQALRAKFRKYAATSLFLLDRGTHEKEQVASLQQVFDGVIDIERERVGGKIERRVAVLSMEGTYVESEYLPLKVSKGEGVVVLSGRPEDVKAVPPAGEPTAPAPEAVHEAAPEEAVPVPPQEPARTEPERPVRKVPSAVPPRGRMGAINGKRREALINGRSAPVRRGHRMRRGQRRVVLAALTVSILSVVGLVSLLVMNPPGGRVTVDGSTDDWSGSLIYDEGRETALADDVDITGYAVQSAGSVTYFYVRMAGDLFATSGNDTGSLLLLIDSDGDPATGYAARGRGADALVTVTGWEGAVQHATLLTFHGNDRMNWSAWEAVSAVKAASRGGDIECGASIPGLDTSAARWWVESSTPEWSDISRGVPGMEGKGILWVEQYPASADLTITGRTEVLDLTFTAFGKGVEVDQVSITSEAQVSALQVPLSVAPGTRLSRSVEVDVSQLPDAAYVHAEVEEVSADGYVSVDGETFTGYVRSLPGSIFVDGAMGEWTRLTDVEVQDDAGDADDNIDLTRGGFSDSLAGMDAFHVSVSGEMMVGALPYATPVRSAGGGGGGGIMLPRESGEDILRIHIDSDGNVSTGEPDGGLGVDRIILVSGREGRVVRTEVLRYEAGWKVATTGFDAVPHQDELELAVPDALLSLTLNWSAYFEMTDWSGESDRTLPSLLFREGWGPGTAGSLITETSLSGSISVSSPSPLAYGVFAAGDAGRNIVLFGGWDGSSYQNRTWIYNTEFNAWEDVSPAVSPSPRIESAMVHRSGTDEFLLFGGSTGLGANDETWVYNLSTNQWTEMFPAVKPSKRYGHGMAYDSESGLVVLFGGWDGLANYGDTWVYDFSTNLWSLKTPVNSPSARRWVGMTYDSFYDRVVLFGGRDLSANLNDTWMYNVDVDEWYNITPASGPSVRSLMSLGYDRSAREVLLFGGYDGGALNDTWALNVKEKVWNERHPPEGPSPRYASFMVWSPYTETAVLFGGFYPNTWNDTWAYRYADDAWRRNDQAGLSWSAVDTGDLDLDGQVEVLSAGTTDTLPKYVVLEVGRWDGSVYTRPANARVMHTWGADERASDVALGDVDGDGQVEVVLVGQCGVAGCLFVLNWTSGASYQLEAEQRWSHGRITEVSALTLDDVDNDGVVDILVTGSHLSGRRGGQVGATLRFTWNGTLLDHRSYVWTPPSTPESEAPLSIASGDLEPDGSPEVVTGGSSWDTKGSWSDISPSVSPPGRTEGSMVYDPDEKRIVLFGGEDWTGSSLNDTWEYDVLHGIWTRTTVNGAPGAPSRRYGQKMVYVESTRRIIMFGGYGPTGYLSDTWEYSTISHTWNEIPGAGPLGRAWYDMAYDSVGDRVILFGGFSGSFLQDTWEFDPTTGIWTMLTPANKPPSRDRLAMTYDPLANKVVLFGGWGPGSLQDTWLFDPDIDTWTEVFPSTLPEPRYNARLEYDAGSKRALLFGGNDGGGRLLNTTWAYDVSTNAWTNVTASKGFSAREMLMSAYVPDLGGAVLFGGYDGSARRNDTWLHGFVPDTRKGVLRAAENAPDTWVDVSSGVAFPPNRDLHSMAYDEQSGRVVLFGGDDNGPGPLGDTWTFDPSTNTWTKQTPAISPPARSDAGMTYITKHDKVLMFGGDDGSTPLGDTWIYDLETDTWQQMFPAVSPPARKSIQYGMVYLDKYDKVILFGGYNTISGDLGDTWEYDLITNTWSARTPVGPPGREMHALAPYGSDGVILFGGLNSSIGVRYGDTWVYDYPSDSWRPLTPATNPPGRYGHAFRYDQFSDMYLMFGGYDMQFLDDTWAYDPAGEDWISIQPDLWPSARAGPGMVFSPGDNTFILFGGEDGSGETADTWGYSFSPFEPGGLLIWNPAIRAEIGSVAIADPDRDGEPEAVAAGYEYSPMDLGDHPTVRSYNYSSGAFGTAEINSLVLSWSKHGHVHDMVARDVDRDGELELAITGNMSSRGFLAILNGSGYPGEIQYDWLTGAFTDSLGVTAGDVDLDGVPEILTSGYSTASPPTGQVNIYNWNIVWPAISDLVLEKGYNWSAASGDISIYGVDTGDIDLDGQMEIAAVGRIYKGGNNFAELVILSWDGSTLTMEATLDWKITGDTFAEDVALGDIDLDGEMEIVVVGRNLSGSASSGMVSVLNWSGVGTPVFEGNMTWWDPGSALMTTVNDVEVFDLDKDGMPEIVTCGSITRTPNQGQVSILTWNGAAFTFERLYNFTTLGWDTYLSALTIGDFDADGIYSIIAVGRYIGGGGNTAGYGAFFTWDGSTLTLKAQIWPSLGGGTHTQFNDVTSSDVDADGTMEVILGGYDQALSGGYEGAIYIVTRTKSGLTLFESSHNWRVAGNTYIWGLRTADPDLDGSEDIITTGYVDMGADVDALLEVWAYPGYALAYRSMWKNISFTYGMALVICDVDSDGGIEMIVAGYSYDGSFYRGAVWIWRLGVDEFPSGLFTSLVAAISAVSLVVLTGRRGRRRAHPG